MTLRRPALAAALLFCAPVMWVSSDSYGNDAAAGPPSSRATTQKLKALTLEHQRKLEREANARKRQDRDSVYQYQDNKGGTTFTNIPEKYERKPGHKQVEMKRVAVTLNQVRPNPKFTKRSSPSQYTGKEYGAVIADCAQRYGVDEDLIYSVIRMESAFNPAAVSPAGACGLMQLMPGTAAEMGVTDIFDAAQNIEGGTQYLSKMLGIFGRVDFALAAYNAGPERVREYQGIPPFTETRNYVRKVTDYWHTLKSGSGISKEALLAQAESKIRTSRNFRPSAPKVAPKQYTIHFNSGLSQPADSVVDKDPYYVIVYNKREYFVRKDLVARIAEPV